MGELPDEFEIEPVTCNYLLEDIPCFDMRTEQGRRDLQDLESPTDFIFIIPEVRWNVIYETKHACNKIHLCILV